MMWRHRHHTPAPVDDRRALLDRVAALQAQIREMETRARYDQLTGLLSREALATEYARCQPRAVLLLDLDGFKQVNDTYGHADGDEVLRVIGARLADLTDVRVARLGGDEIVILTDTDPYDVVVAAVGQIRQPISLPGGVSVRVGASVGVRVCLPGLTLAQALRSADQAMYEAKRTAGVVCTWTPGMGGLPTHRIRDARAVLGEVA